MEKSTPSMTVELQTNYQGVNVSDVIVKTISSSKEQKNSKKVDDQKLIDTKRWLLQLNLF